MELLTGRIRRPRGVHSEVMLLARTTRSTIHGNSTFCENNNSTMNYISAMQAMSRDGSQLASFSSQHLTCSRYLYSTECTFHPYPTTLNGYLLRCFAFVFNDTIAPMLYNKHEYFQHLVFSRNTLHYLASPKRSSILCKRPQMSS